MNYDDKILQILKNSKLRHRLSEIGIYPSIGLQKVIGPTGSMQEVMPTSYNAIFFASYAQAHYSRVMQLQETIEIPTNLYVRYGVDWRSRNSKY